MSDHLTEPEIDWQRRAIVHLDARDLARILELPDGVRVVSVHDQVNPSGLAVVVEGDHLAPVVPGGIYPMLRGSLNRRVVRDDDGQEYVRWGWMPETPDDLATDVEPDALPV